MQYEPRQKAKIRTYSFGGDVGRTTPPSFLVYRVHGTVKNGATGAQKFAVVYRTASRTSFTRHFLGLLRARCSACRETRREKGRERGWFVVPEDGSACRLRFAPERRTTYVGRVFVARSLRPAPGKFETKGIIRRRDGHWKRNRILAPRPASFRRDGIIRVEPVVEIVRNNNRLRRVCVWVFAVSIPTDGNA